MLPYERSVCDSPFSSPPLFEPVYQLCADPRPEKHSLYIQKDAPFMSSDVFQRDGDHKSLFSNQNETRNRLSHPPDTSQDYLSVL